MYGLIGKKLSHSFSKIIHESINRNISYDLIELDSIDHFMSTKDFKAINVTIPYKSAVTKYIDQFDIVSKETGVVNTVVNKSGVLYGYNTDYYGLNYVLDNYSISLKNKTIVVLGNGSTSRTIQYLCKLKGAKKTIVYARNPRASEKNILNDKITKEANIIFNATPVGMYPNNETTFNIDFDLLPNLELVMDLVYNPLRTNLILEAEKHNIKAVNGLLMLVAQAIEAARLFYNIAIEDQKTIAIHNEIYKNIVNYVFIGMPMSGKTYTANRISVSKNKQLIDIDSQIENDHGPIENIFKNSGESLFRSLESGVVNNLYKHSSLAVSCGGGIILNLENMNKLKQNGVIIFMDAPLTFLQSMNPKNRPLLQDEHSLKNLYNNRIHLYNKYTDIIVKKDTFDIKIIENEIEVRLNEYFDTKWT